MIDYKKFICALRQCASEHDSDPIFIGEINTTDLCRETADLLESLEKEPCEDAVSRISLLNKLDDCYKEKIKVAPDNMAEGFMQVEKLIKQEPSVRPVACIAKVKFNKEDMQKIVDEKVKEITTMEGDRVTCKDCKYNTKNGKYTAVCDMGHRFRMREPSTFYCADGERRE